MGGKCKRAISCVERDTLPSCDENIIRARINVLFMETRSAVK